MENVYLHLMQSEQLAFQKEPQTLKKRRCILAEQTV